MRRRAVLLMAAAALPQLGDHDPRAESWFADKVTYYL
jgi:hypothetical protein